MAGGGDIYVGKSRLRRKFRDKRREKRRGGSPKHSRRKNGSGSPPTRPSQEVIPYQPLAGSEDAESLAFAEFDSCSTGSSDSEELLPLIELRPQTTSFPALNTMPLFGKKKKAAAEAAKKESKTEPPKEEPEVKKEVPVPEEEGKITVEKTVEVSAEKKVEEPPAEEKEETKAEDNASTADSGVASQPNGEVEKLEMKDMESSPVAEDEKAPTGMVCCIIL